MKNTFIYRYECKYTHIYVYSETTPDFQIVTHTVSHGLGSVIGKRKSLF